MFTVKIETDNAAFKDDDEVNHAAAAGAECARILRGIADSLESGRNLENGRCLDINGNYVGRWALEMESE